MSTIIDTAVAAARAAGNEIRAASAQIGSLEIEQKSAFDYVSNVDRESEALIKSIIANAFPTHDVLGEEYGLQKASDGSNQPLWIVDPLDGTTNFIRQIPHFAVSIAVQINGELAHAVVYDVAKDELFQASLGQGCLLNGRALRPLTQRDFSGALLATGVPFSGQMLAEYGAFSGTMSDLLSCGTSGIRRLGSAALDLAYVAAGRYDGYWEARLNPWDIAAGALLVQEAGGLVSNFIGEAGFLESGDIVAAPNGIHANLVAVTAVHYAR